MSPRATAGRPRRFSARILFAAARRTGLLTFMTTGAGFFRSSYTPDQRPQSVYGQFARLADVAGFDLYPLGHCSNDLSAVYDAQLAFNRIAGQDADVPVDRDGRRSSRTYCGGFKMQPAELRAEVWLAVAGGARGHRLLHAHLVAATTTPSTSRRRSSARWRRTNNLLVGRPARRSLGQTILSGRRLERPSRWSPGGRATRRT